MIDYKFKYISTDKISTRFKIFVYEGDTTTKDEYNPVTRVTEPVTRYRRTQKLGEKNLEISDGSDIRLFTNSEFIKDYPTKTAINGQK